MRRFGLTLFVLLAALAWAVPGIAAAASAPPAAQAAADPLAQQPVQQAELSDPGAATDDEFGYSVALSGDTALIGAPHERQRSERRRRRLRLHALGDELVAAGRAERRRRGVRRRVRHLGGALRRHGAGRRPRQERRRSERRRRRLRLHAARGRAGSQQAELSDPDAAVGDYFGNSVALSGDTALIGALDKTVGRCRAAPAPPTWRCSPAATTP